MDSFSHRLPFVAFLCVLFISGCATFYEKNQSIHKHLIQSDYAAAWKAMDQYKKGERPNVQVLRWLDRGVIAAGKNDPMLSNTFFDEADRYTEERRKNIGQEILATVSNPMVVPYQPESYENILIQYYKAWNFYQLQQPDAALVEIRRMNEKVLFESDRVKERHRYQEDALAHLMMGWMYEHNGDHNNAFIAYRNALKVFDGVYKNAYQIAAPEVLKRDLLASAARMGFWDEVSFFEKQFNMKHEKVPVGYGEVIVVWENGMAPVKAEWSLNFTILPGTGGMVTFVNESMGWSFPVFVGNSNDQAKLTNLKVVRVAMPKMVERPPAFTQATIGVGAFRANLSLVQDYFKIAQGVLQDRLAKEMGKTLLRVALKQASETAVRKSSKNESVGEGLGFALGLVNAITEKADTRNWQTIPHSIYYGRLALPGGSHQLQLRMGSLTRDLPVEIKAGRTQLLRVRVPNSLEIKI